MITSFASLSSCPLLATLRVSVPRGDGMDQCTPWGGWIKLCQAAQAPEETFIKISPGNKKDIGG